MFINRDRARQLIDFDGITYDNMHPTDLDGMFDYHDRGYAFFEMKYKGADFPYGQKLMMERLVNLTSADGRKSIAVVAEHSIDDCSKDIQADACIVRMLYYSDEKVWRKPKKPMTLRNLMDSFGKIVGFKT